MKKRKMDEPHLWAELKGNEQQIKDLLEVQNRVRRELTHHMINRERMWARVVARSKAA